MIGWRNRYAQGGIAALGDAARSGRRAAGVSFAMVATIWRKCCQPFAWTKTADEIIAKIKSS